MNRFVTFLFLMIVGMALAGCKPPGKQTPTAPAGKAKTGETVSQPLNRLADGSSVSLSNFRGKKVLLYFMAPWTDSGPAALELVESMNLADVEILPVVVDRNGQESDIGEFGSRLAALNACMADDGLLAAVGGVRALPTAVLLGPDGEVVGKWAGFVPRDQLVAQIENPIPLSAPAQ